MIENFKHTQNLKRKVHLATFTSYPATAVINSRVFLPPLYPGLFSPIDHMWF